MGHHPRGKAGERVRAKAADGGRVDCHDGAADRLRVRAASQKNEDHPSVFQCVLQL